MLSELRSLAHLTGGVRHRDEGQVWAEGGGQADDVGEQAHGSQNSNFLSFPLHVSDWLPLLLHLLPLLPS